MGNLNGLVCVLAGGNTGFGDCVLDIKNMVGAFLIPKGKEFTPSELADFQATLQAAAQAVAADRIYPIHGFEQITDNSEDKTIQTLGYGGKYPVREGDYDWTFQFVQGGFCLLKSLRKFNGSGKDVLFYDANGIIYGQKVGSNLAGIPLVFFWANPFKLNDGTNTSIYGVQFVFKPKYANDNLGFVQTDFLPSSIAGLQEVVLSEVGASALPDLIIKALTGCAGVDLYDTYADELADDALWVALNAEGAEITITSVTKNAANKGWNVTLDDNDPDYPASANDGDITIKLAAPTVLAAAGIEGYESLTLDVGNPFVS